MKNYKLYINGKLEEGSKSFDAIDPSVGDVFAKVSDASIDDMQKAICSAREAFDEGPWPKMTIAERGIYLKGIAKIIRDNAKELAELETQDVGKTSKQTTFIDVPTTADTFEYFSNVEKWLEDKENSIDAPVKSLTLREPIGVVGCIIPWNYPLIMLGWKVAPALIAGNTVVFRPSSQASVSIARLAELISNIGLPEGVLNIVTSKDHDVSSELIKSDMVDKISFTGGTETGRDVMKMATGNVKKLTLELGGKSPNIVFSDCDFEAAIGGTMSAIFMNQGQMCTAGSRLILQEEIYEKFLDELVVRTKKLKVGSAKEVTTDFGPLVSKKQLDNVLKYIDIGKNEAKCMCGGNVVKVEGCENGFYVEPTIFADVENSMKIAQDEIFGPVLSVIKFKTVEEAILIANDSEFGLASCVWTKDKEKIDKVSRELKAGTVWVNTYGGFYDGASFGGYKQSGFGRELGLDGLLEFTQSKHVCVDETPGGKPLVASWF